MKRNIWDIIDPQAWGEITTDQLVNTVVGLMGTVLAIGCLAMVLFI